MFHKQNIWKPTETSELASYNTNKSKVIRTKINTYHNAEEFEVQCPVKKQNGLTYFIVIHTVRDFLNVYIK